MTVGERQLGPYTVLGKLGAGGMGEVYLALDPRLEREVALKVLPAALTHDAEQLGRFRREALTLASLNHPNIATIFGFEEPEGGPMVLVLEHVEGESLALRLKRSRLSMEEALHICVQIAEALEVAHARGVVHRDMKPGNVMIAARGLVKVLDFGLAKKRGGLMELKEREAAGLEAQDRQAAAEQAMTEAATIVAPRPEDAPTVVAPPREAPAPEDAPTVVAPPRAAAPSPEDAPTIATPRAEALPSGESWPLKAPLTEQGAVMGTPGYMSPEQVVAGELDQRTDVFAFGCVLYECLAGRRAFTGKNAYEVMAAVLTDKPDFSALPERTPARVRELLVHCLARDAEQRLGEMRVARLELEEALGIRHAAALRAGEATATPNNLPAQATSFVGRDAAIAECAKLLGASRVLTLTGMGGSGKTRLALRLAEARLGQHPDGVWFADLAPLAEAERVPEVVSAVLQVREEPGRPLMQAIVDHVGTRRMLIVLDNCEHLLEACGKLAAQLVGACPELKLLVTSHEPLAIPGEVVFAVPTLAVPTAAASDAAALAGNEAVRLFAERAALAQPEFTVTDANAAAVGEICRRLDGIPLAIELAAARVRVLSVEQIRGRLDDRFRLLTGGSKSALPRQQTLLAALQWSWDHLAALEQQLLRRLSVFHGGWTLERATRVSEENGDEFEILDLLTRLVDKSLVVVQRRAEGAARYWLLESVWRFAQERLAESGERDAVAARHLDAFLQLAEESEHQLAGPKQGEWFADLDLEQENLLAALAECARAADGAERGLRLTGSVCRFWSARGHYELGRRALREALLRDTTAASAAPRAKALVRAGGFALYQGDYDGARPLIEESLAICRQLEDRKGVARALSGLGVVAMYQSDLARAHAIGVEALELYREIGEKRGVAMGLHNLGYIAWCRNDPGEARDRFDEALVLLQQVGDQETIALTLSGLGSALARVGDRAAARERLLRCVELVRELGAKREGVYAIEAIADFALDGGEAAGATRLMSAAEEVRRAIGSPLTPVERRERDAMRARLAEALGPAALAAALAAGKALLFEAALTEAETLLANTARTG